MARRAQLETTELTVPHITNVVIVHAEIETSGRMTTHLRVRYERAACVTDPAH